MTLHQLLGLIAIEVLQYSKVRKTLKSERERERETHTQREREKRDTHSDRLCLLLASIKRKSRRRRKRVDRVSRHFDDIKLVSRCKFGVEFTGERGRGRGDK